VPIEPDRTRWALREPHPDDDDLIGIGADLEPGTVLAAYRTGLFPMHVGKRQLGWWSPNPRGILPLDGMHVSRSLRQACHRYEIRVNTAFADVMRLCATTRTEGNWINGPIIASYSRLHQLGWAHSIEVWSADNRLVGGLYGVAIGGLFAGESMFHLERDTSKVALVALVEILRSGGSTLLDVQWQTEHLATLGVIAIPRPEYFSRLSVALATNGNALLAPNPELRQ
jgi:leucyl/phenylalanyl-tRNA--protein transferase